MTCSLASTRAVYTDMKGKDLTGQVFGRLTVVGIADSWVPGDHSKIWSCKCACGNTKEASTNLLTRGKVKSCGCIKSSVGPDSYHWRGHGLISSKQWFSIQNNAKSRKHTFTLTIEEAWQLFEKQQGLCALSKVKLNFQASKYDKQGTTASLDRIDSSKGYEIGNVQWVHKTINLMKNKMTEEQFYWWCTQVAQNAGRLF